MKKILLIILLCSLLVPNVAIAKIDSNKIIAQSVPEDQSVKQDRTYSLPLLPKPEGLPGFSSDEESDPEEARQFFIKDMLPRITKLLITLIGLASFVMLLYGGFQYYTTFGQSDKADSAKETVKYAIIGVVVAMLSFAIVQIIGSLPFI